ncbi:MAG: uncharacterized protein PWQ58_1637 [Archaeoglobaceae archaeon]|nr:uncharacterized protein [Archaeoglobaceae archaeon]
MDPVTAILLFITGLIAGTLGGLLGIGGCVIMLPSLTFIFNYPLAVAIGTTITAVILTASSGAIGHIRMKNVDYSTAKIVAISGAVGAMVGSIIFFYIADQIWLLNLILGFAFLYVALRMIYEGIIKRKMPERAGNEVPGSKASKGAIGFFIGIITGIVGLGGGYALVPSVSGAFKLYQGLVDIIAAISIGIGAVIGAQLGARLVKIVPSWAIKAIFGFIFLYVSLRFIWQGFVL